MPTQLPKDNQELSFSQNYACEDCGISLTELEPRMFSFNNPNGACPSCTGLGFQLIADEDLVIPDKNKSIFEGAIQASGRIRFSGCILKPCPRSIIFL